MKVYIVTIGDEILIGQIIDSNAAWMGEFMTLNGSKVVGITSVSDEKESIIKGIEFGLELADVVLVSGGLGPTKDDITKKALADHFGMNLEFHEETFAEIQKLFARFGRSMTQAHREQSYMPVGAKILRNKMGTAPGMVFEKDNKLVISMPGVPYEMKYLVEHEVIQLLKQRFKPTPSFYKTIMTSGEGESRIAAKIAMITDEFPPNVKIAFLPNLGFVRLRVGISGLEEMKAKEELENFVNKVVNTIPDLVYGFDELSLSQALQETFIHKDLSLAVAESCTGGFLAHKITENAGSSRYFKGGLVAYSNAIKNEHLKVDQNTLENFGAVSEQTVKEMTKGALISFESDIAVSISGIAGPGGGTALKPVGTIWMAIGNKKTIETYKLQLGKDRLKNIEYTVNFVLNKLRSFVLTNY